MVQRWQVLIGWVVMTALMVTGCVLPDPANDPPGPTSTPDPAAPPEACGLPCDSALNLNCPAGLQCISGVCLNEIVCGNCGKTCVTNADCPLNWPCDTAYGAPAGSQTYCWPYGQHGCAMLTEDYCGYPCVFEYNKVQDPQLGGYTCFYGVLISMDKNQCGTCGKDCTSDADCGPGTTCTQFPSFHPEGTWGYCWGYDTCVAQVVGPQGTLPPLSTPLTLDPNEITPPVAGPDPELIPPVIDNPACNANGVCDPGENKDLCGDADCPCIDDGVCGPGETGQCQDCITPPPGSGDSSGGDDGGEVCGCSIVCVEEDRSGNCIRREGRDCNGQRCTP